MPSVLFWQWNLGVSYLTLHTVFCSSFTSCMCKSEVVSGGGLYYLIQSPDLVSAMMKIQIVWCFLNDCEGNSKIPSILCLCLGCTNPFSHCQTESKLQIPSQNPPLSRIAALKINCLTLSVGEGKDEVKMCTCHDLITGIF